MHHLCPQEQQQLQFHQQEPQLQSQLPQQQQQRQEQRRRHCYRKGFKRFGVGVVLASIAWWSLLWRTFDRLFEAQQVSNPIGDSPIEDRPTLVVARRNSSNSNRSSNGTTTTVAKDKTGTDSGAGRQQQQQQQQQLQNQEKRNPEHRRMHKGEYHGKPNDCFPRILVLNHHNHGGSLPADDTPAVSELLSQWISEEETGDDRHNKKDPILDDYRPRSHALDQSNLEELLEGQFTEDYQRHCVDMAEWQSLVYPVCNSVHELGILGGSVSSVVDSGLEYLGRGNWRSAFSIRDLHNHRHGDGDGDGDKHDDEHDDYDNHEYEYGDDDCVVLKLFHLHNDEEYPFDPRAYEMHRIDALVSQKLTSSPYVLDIYGHCALTGIYEKGVSDLDAVARFHRQNQKQNRGHKHKPKDPSSIAADDTNHREKRAKDGGDRDRDDAWKVRYAAQIARAVSDLHGTDYPIDPTGGNPSSVGSVPAAASAAATIVHGDLKPENIVLAKPKRNQQRQQRTEHGEKKNGESSGTATGKKKEKQKQKKRHSSQMHLTKLVAKLGDFNNSILRKWNTTSQRPCPYYNSPYEPSWGLGYKPLEHSSHGFPPLDESVDVFGVGGLLYYVLVGKDPYFQYPKGSETRAMRGGELPPLPPMLSYNTSQTHGGNTALLTATGVVSASSHNKYRGNSSTATETTTAIPRNNKMVSTGIQAIIAAIQASMKVQPGDRPTSKQVADLFQSINL